DAIAQTTTGTIRMRAIVIRLGRFKAAPRFGRPALAGGESHPDGNRGWLAHRRSSAKLGRPALPNVACGPRLPRCRGRALRRGRSRLTHARGGSPAGGGGGGHRGGERMGKGRPAIVFPGGGSNRAALFAPARAAVFPAEIALVLTNRAQAAGLSAAI